MGTEQRDSARDLIVRSGLLLVLLVGGVGLSLLLPEGDEPEPPAFETPITQPEEAAPAPVPQPLPPVAAGPEQLEEVPEPAPEPGERTVIVRGTVHDLDSSPTPRAEIWVSLGNWVRGRGRSDTEGRFAVPARVSAKIPFGKGRKLRLLVQASAPGRFTDRQVVELGDEVHFVLGPGGHVRGKITYKGHEEPVSGAYVAFRNQSGARFTAETNASGVYRIGRIRPGRYEVTVRPPLHSEFKDITTVAIQAGPNERIDFSLAPPDFIGLQGRVTDRMTREPIAGAEIAARAGKLKVEAKSDEEGRFRLPDVPRHARLVVTADGYAPLLTFAPSPVLSIRLQRLARLRGRVVDEEAAPIAGASVTVSRLGRERATTDADGFFEIGIQPGSRSETIHVSAKGYAPARRSHRVRYRPGETEEGLVITMVRGAIITGTVRDEQGRPVAKAIVSKCFTDDSGAYRLEDLAPGDYTMKASKTGYLPHRRKGQLTVAAGQRLEGIDFVLRKGSFIAGRVVGPDEIPVAAASVLARRSDLPNHPRLFRSIAGHQSRADGSFRLEGLPDGRYKVSAHRRGFHLAVVDAHTGAGDLVIRLVPLATVTGFVRVAASGQPLTKFELRIRWSGQFSDGWVSYSDPGGRFTLPDVEVGRFGLEARGGGMVTAEPRVVTVTRGETPPPVVLSLEPVVTLRGVVLGPDGTPQPKARVTVFPEKGAGTGRFYATADTKGKFTVTAARPGPYRIRASHPDGIDTLKRTTLSLGNQNWVELKLHADGGAAKVFVTDQDGVPVAGAAVTVHHVGDRELRPDRRRYDVLYRKRKQTNPSLKFKDFYRSYTVTDLNGALIRRFLPAGRLEVRARKEGFTASKAEVEVYSGAETPVFVKITRKK